MATNRIVSLADCPKIDSLLNNQEANYLADLFLARYEIKSAKRYRYFKNAVLAFSRGKWDADEIFHMLAKAADMPTEQMQTELRAAIKDLPEPVYKTFNRYYANDRAEVYSDRPDDPPHIRMGTSKTLNYIFGFLGYAFLTIIISNYPIYNAVKTIKA